MTPPVRCRGVVKRFGSETVLDGIDLELAAGESVGLIGVNGAGKSTLLKSMFDLIAIDDGTIELFGIDRRDTAARQHAAFLVENFHAPYFASGHDYLRFLTRLHGARAEAAAIHAECELLDLDPAALARPARQYSKGMRQKLGLIACILSACRLLVLDEPLSGLDPKARAAFTARLKALADDGVTVLFSTHLLDDIAAVCDRVAVLDGGRIAFFGTVAEFDAAFPAASRNASFLRCIEASGAA